MAMEALELAVQELEAMQAIFGYEAEGFVLHSEAGLLGAQAALEDAGGAPAAADFLPPQLDFELRLAVKTHGREDQPIFE